MSAWEKIREARTDLTDHVVHLTRLGVDLGNGKKQVRAGFSRLKESIRCGYLRPSTSPRLTIQRNRNHTVRGPHPPPPPPHHPPNPTPPTPKPPPPPPPPP